MGFVWKIADEWVDAEVDGCGSGWVRTKGSGKFSLLIGRRY